MGRIKSLAIKKAAKKLAGEIDDFTKDFNHNKLVLKAYTLPDKSTRNKIAGHIVRIKRAKDLQNK